MNTSDLISIGSRPLLPTTSPTYSTEPKDILFIRLKSALRLDPSTTVRKYDQSLYEFPGDRTRSRSSSGEVY